MYVAMYAYLHNHFRWKSLLTFHGDLLVVTIVTNVHWLAVMLLLEQCPLVANMVVKALFLYLSYVLSKVLKMIGHIWKVMKHMFLVVHIVVI